MPKQNYVYPGGGTFINKVASDHQDGSMIGTLSRLAPVQTALGLIGNVTTAPDVDTRNDLLRRASEQVKYLQAGITVIQHALDEVAGSFEGTQHPAPSGIPGALQRPKPASTRPTIGDIRSAPIDPGELGITGTAKPPGWDAAQQRAQAATREAERIARDGIDEGMSGDPPRPDTGVNQTMNQMNVPSQYEAPIQQSDYKQQGNPPRTEPNETDDGTGDQIRHGPTEGSGLTQAAMIAGQGGAPTPDDFRPPDAQQGPSEEAPAGQGTPRRGRKGS